MVKKETYQKHERQLFFKSRAVREEKRNLRNFEETEKEYKKSFQAEEEIDGFHSGLSFTPEKA